MTIPLAELVSWSNYPTPIRPGWSHAAIKSALLADGHFGGHSVDVYVQGSYRNLVNTRWDSDVDIVAELNSVCFYDTSWLNRFQQDAFWRTFSHSSLTFHQFRSEVFDLLQRRFSSAVESHSKAIEVQGNWRRLKVDVLPAIRYREVRGFHGTGVTATDGIIFWTTDGRAIVNWPQQHFENGARKHEASGGNYRPAVRMFKSARRIALQHELIRDHQAPSYFLQGLLWNVPTELFGPDRSATYLGVVNWLHYNRAYLHQFRCQNNRQLLCGLMPEQWNLSDAYASLDAFGQLWNNWSQLQGQLVSHS